MPESFVEAANLVTKCGRVRISFPLRPAGFWRRIKTPSTSNPRDNYREPKRSNCKRSKGMQGITEEEYAMKFCMLIILDERKVSGMDKYAENFKYILE